MVNDAKQITRAICSQDSDIVNICQIHPNIEECFKLGCRNVDIKDFKFTG